MMGLFAATSSLSARVSDRLTIREPNSWAHSAIIFLSKLQKGCDKRTAAAWLMAKTLLIPALTYLVIAITGWAR